MLSLVFIILGVSALGVIFSVRFPVPAPPVPDIAFKELTAEAERILEGKQVITALPAGYKIEQAHFNTHAEIRVGSLTFKALVDDLLDASQAVDCYRDEEVDG